MPFCEKRWSRRKFSLTHSTQWNPVCVTVPPNLAVDAVAFASTTHTHTVTGTGTGTPQYKHFSSFLLLPELNNATECSLGSLLSSVLSPPTRLLPPKPWRRAVSHAPWSSILPRLCLRAATAPSIRSLSRWPLRVTLPLLGGIGSPRFLARPCWAARRRGGNCGALREGSVKCLPPGESTARGGERLLRRQRRRRSRVKTRNWSLVSIFA